MSPLDLAAHHRYLLDPDGTVLHQALTGSPDGTVPGLEFTVDAVHYRPGRDVSVGYQVWLADGSDDEEYLVATTAAVDGEVVTLDSDDYSFRVWRHPHDPVLTSTADAYDADTVASWLETARLDTGEVRLESLAYRPMRRAVLRADADAGTWFVKVQRPTRHLEYLERMAVLGGAGITPPVVTVPATGVSITAAAHGVSLAQALAAWSMEGAVEPDVESILDLQRRIPCGVLTFDRRTDWVGALRGHGEAASVELPERADEVAALVRRLEKMADTASLGPVVPVHGDFYEANIFTRDGQATAVIDIESVGPGHLVDDLACLLGHLVVLPDLSQAHYAQLPALTERCWDAAAAFVHPPTLGARVAGLVLGLVSGSGDEQANARLDRALAVVAERT